MQKKTIHDPKKIVYSPNVVYDIKGAKCRTLSTECKRVWRREAILPGYYKPGGTCTCFIYKVTIKEDVVK